MRKILYPLCIVMAVLIVVISLTTATFSWFEPDAKEGVGLQFVEEAALRAENCVVATYRGELNITPGTPNYGLVEYDESRPVGTTTVNAGTTVYFKSVITNNNEDKDTVVSLYLRTFNVSSNNGSASLGVATPTNSYRTFTSSQTDLHIIRNAYVSYKVENEARTGEVVVEWFVRCDSGYVTFSPGSAYLTYN